MYGSGSSYLWITRALLSANLYLPCVPVLLTVGWHVEVYYFVYNESKYSHTTFYIWEEENLT